MFIPNSLSTLRLLLLTGVGSLALFSCDPPTPEPQPLYNLAKDGNNVFIINEGAYGTPNGAVSLFSKTSKTVVDKNIFTTVNQGALGDVVQSMLVVGQQGYIVVNNSNKVEVVNLTTFKSEKTITGLQQPRYMVVAGTNKAYISQWQGSPSAGYTAGKVAVLDLTTNTVTSSINVGVNPEQMLLANGKVYVCNSDQNTLSVINTATNAVESTITVQDAPRSIVQDNAGNIWVLCSGITRYGPAPSFPILSATPANLIKLSAGTLTPTVFPFASGGASGLTLNGNRDQLYYRYRGAVYQMSIGSATLPASPLIRRSFYGLAVDPRDNTIYGSISPFTTAGKFIRYQPTGAAIDSFEVNIGPNGFVFY
ncbi:hypothetical protein LJY25_17690 [Hymenobacter sp. BT175]|uniref:DUF5074 domain-containing protein n=1 Tax=Hymenobacter translucens TaxID=2886507 RepID=UPI001D0EE6AC|nr:DUF5074 domain-containing protein [Hymenobacter translucens]MCC2548286.1 hypothetical protein [Hymenobacter translucens]